MRLRPAVVAGVLLAAAPLLRAAQWLPLTTPDEQPPGLEVDATSLARFSDLRWVKVRFVGTGGAPLVAPVIVNCSTGSLVWLGAEPQDEVPTIPPSPANRLARAACAMD